MAAGGVIGRKLELVTRDTEGAPTKAVRLRPAAGAGRKGPAPWPDP